jgi:N-acetylneuraminic acid mutarotase
MKRIAFFMMAGFLLASMNGCGNLFDLYGVAPTLQQKLRGIWMVGGLQQAGVGNTVAAVDLYDPDTDTWFAGVTNLPTPVSFAGAASYQSKIFVFGGFDSSGTALATTQIYDVITDTWTSGASINAGSAPYTRANITAVEKGGDIYVLSGTSGDASAAWAVTTTNYIYSVSGDSWTTTTAAASRANYSCVDFDSSLYYMGGRSAVATPTNAHDAFNTVALQWTTSVTEVALAANKCGMAIGAYSPANGSSIIATAGGFSLITGTNGNYVFNGTSASNPVNQFYFLNFPFTAPATWDTLTAQPYPLTIGCLSGVVSGNKFYCFGGTSTHNAPPVASAYYFNLDDMGGSNWMPCADMPVARFGHTAVTIRQ